MISRLRRLQEIEQSLRTAAAETRVLTQPEIEVLEEIAIMANRLRWSNGREDTQ
jgi:hypothetical protein